MQTVFAQCKVKNCKPDHHSSGTIYFLGGHLWVPQIIQKIKIGKNSYVHMLGNCALNCENVCVLCMHVCVSV